MRILNLVNVGSPLRRTRASMYNSGTHHREVGHAKVLRHLVQLAMIVIVCHERVLVHDAAHFIHHLLGGPLDRSSPILIDLDVVKVVSARILGQLVYVAHSDWPTIHLVEITRCDLSAVHPIVVRLAHWEVPCRRLWLGPTDGTSSGTLSMGSYSGSISWIHTLLWVVIFL
jgi:hypothetical protein